MDEVCLETPRELPLRSWVSSLLGAEALEQGLIAQEADAEALARAASSLVYALQSIRKLTFSTLRVDTAMALREVERFLTHPGRSVEPAHTIYWDWTMDASCAEEVPAAEVSVASEARQTAVILRQCLPAGPSEVRNQPKG